MHDLEGQIFICTGAASGIGRATARSLAVHGAHVHCVDVDEAGALVVAEGLRSEGLAAAFSVADVRDADAMNDVVQRVLDARGQVHGLVNCAGVTGQTGLRGHEVPLEDFDRVVAINLRGAFICTRAVVPAMLDRSYGRILHVASIAGKDGNAGMVSYSASKAGLIGMVKVLGKEYAMSGVTVNALAPAVIQTPLVEQMPTSQVEYMTSRIPMGRVGTLDEATAMIRFIVSSACSFTTGFTFDLSGGRATY